MDWSSIAPFGVMIVVFYFLLIRPQQQRKKRHEDRQRRLWDTPGSSSSAEGLKPDDSVNATNTGSHWLTKLGFWGAVLFGILGVCGLIEAPIAFKLVAGSIVAIFVGVARRDYLQVAAQFRSPFAVIFLGWVSFFSVIATLVVVFNEEFSILVKLSTVLGTAIILAVSSMLKTNNKKR